MNKVMPGEKKEIRMSECGFNGFFIFTRGNTADVHTDVIKKKNLNTVFFIYIHPYNEKYMKY